MSDSTNVLSRFVAVMFFVAAGTGVYAVMTHSKLKAAEQTLATVEHQRETLQEKLSTTEKTVTEKTTAAQTCTAELDGFKSRAEAAESALENAKGKKSPARSSAG